MPTSWSEILEEGPAIDASTVEALHKLGHSLTSVHPRDVARRLESAADLLTQWAVLLGPAQALPPFESVVAPFERALQSVAARKNPNETFTLLVLFHALRCCGLAVPPPLRSSLRHAVGASYDS